MSDLLVCLAFVWYVAVLLGIAMIEWRLSRIAKRIDEIEREDRRRNGGSR
jgi:ribosomal protein L15E